MNVINVVDFPINGIAVNHKDYQPTTVVGAKTKSGKCILHQAEQSHFGEAEPAKRPSFILGC